MSELGKKKEPVPDLFENRDLSEGLVYVVVAAETGFHSLYKGGEEAVLETKGGGQLELKTAENVRGQVTAEGTYLSSADIAALDGNVAEPTLRRYGLMDTLAKAKSKAGIILILVTLIGLLVAIFGLVVAIAGESGTTTAAVAERSEALVAWVAKPSETLERSTAPGTVVSVRAEIERRRAAADQCLAMLRGGEGQVSQVAGVKCTANDVVWWKDKELAALVAAFAGAAVTILGVFGVLAKFGFRKSPAGE